MWNRLKILANRLIYWIGRNFGIWIVRVVAWGIATGYFFLAPSRVHISIEFYRAVFAGRSRLFYLYCVWRQFHDLAQNQCDEMALSFEAPINYTAEGRDYIQKAAEAGKGGIVIISHLGGWGVAARLFRRGGFKVMMIMGEREARLVAQKHREELENDGLKILVSQAEDRDSLFIGIEALKFIREGGFLCIAGDIGWTDTRSRHSATFFDRDIFLPAGPHTLALVSGAPVFTLFTLRSGRGKYRFLILPPRHVKAASRDKRNIAIEESVQIYASQLEEVVRQYPYGWHVFESIFVDNKHTEK